MENLNIIRQFSAFAEKSKNELKAPAMTLYVALLHLANQSSFEGGVCPVVRVDNARLMKYAAIGSKHTLREQRRILIRLGYIKYQKGRRVEGKNIVGQYTLIKLY